MEPLSKENNQALQRVVLFIVIGSNFAGIFMSTSINILIPHMGEEFSIRAGAVGWIATIYMLSIATFAIPFGKLADTLGRRTVFVWGAFGFAISSVFLFFTPNIIYLIIFRALQGACGGLTFGTNYALLTEHYPASKRGSALGISTSVTYLGTALGPAIAGWMSEQYGWRYVFLLMALLSSLVGLAACSFIPRSKRVTGKGLFDPKGSLLYGLSIFSVMYGLSSLAKIVRGVSFFALGIVFLFLFIRQEKRVANPVLEIHLFTDNVQFPITGIATIINFGAVHSITYFLSIYLQVVRGMSGSMSGLIFLAYPAAMILLSSWTGRLSDRISPFLVSSVGMILSALALVLLSFLSFDTTVLVIVIKLLFVGFGFSFFSSPNTNAIMSCVDKKDFGIASSMLATGRTLGQSISMAITSMVIAFRVADATLYSADPKELLASQRTIFLLYASLCVLSAFVTMRARRIRECREPASGK